MSKLEERFKEVIYIADKYDYLLDSELKQLIKQCAEITEQECIGFAEWVISQEEFEGDYTIKELFQLYQKSKENEI